MANERGAITAELLDDDAELTLAELCRVCRVPAEQVFELVEYGIVEPAGREPAYWRFRAVSVSHIRRAVQLRRDLDVNWAGAALALELLDELQALRARLRRLEES